jgi:hypothetical protein
MRSFRHIILLGILISSAFYAQAQTGSFLNVPKNTREIAMGGVNAGSDAESVLNEETIMADASYLIWSPGGVGTNLITAELGYRLGKLAILAEGGANLYKPYPAFDEYGNSSGEYSPKETVFGIGAAYCIMPGFGISVMAKYAGAQLSPTAKSAAFCADVNIAYHLKSLTLGVSGSNIGSGSLPIFLEAGARNTFCLGKTLKLEAGLEAGYITQGQHNAVIASAGVNLKIKELISIMAGYHFSTNTTFEPSYASAGIGIDISMIKISAAYLTGNPYIGNTIGFTVGCAF